MIYRGRKRDPNQSVGFNRMTADRSDTEKITYSVN